MGIYFLLEIPHIFDKAELLQLLNSEARTTPECPYVAEATLK
jgi:hypothetical protein